MEALNKDTSATAIDRLSVSSLGIEDLPVVASPYSNTLKPYRYTSISRTDDRKPGGDTVMMVHKKSVKDYNERDPQPVNKASAIIALNASACLDGCDDQLLPASFRALEKELKLHPSILGQIALAQTMALSLSCPLWGYLADRFRRRYIMSIGMISWGLTTILLAFASDITSIMILRALNGFFLGSIGPISQSILADIAPQKSRGFQFGLVQMCSSGGRIVGGVVTTSIAFTHFGGLSGWRWTFFTVGAMSLLLGLVIGCCVGEFNRSHDFELLTERKVSGVGLELAAAAGTGETESGVEHTRNNSNTRILESSGEIDGNSKHPDQTASQFFKSVITESLSIPSVLLIVLEGIVGTIPWSAMSFLTMYFQYCGLSDTSAGFVSASLLLGAMISGPIGGLLGDRIFQWSPNHGRPFLGQLSMLCRIPLLLLAFIVVPPEPSSFVWLSTICLCLGLSSVAGVVVNRPLLSDVVMPNHRATTFALAVAVEGATASLFGAPIVGLLAESRFGYTRTDLHIAEIPDDLRRNNAHALGHALVCLTVVPWILSFVTYGLVHWTYGPDRDLLNEKLRQETRRRETGDSGSQELQLIRPPDSGPFLGIY